MKSMTLAIFMIVISNPLASAQDIEKIVNGIEKSPYFQRAEKVVKRNEETLQRKVQKKVEEKRVTISAINEQIRNGLIRSEVPENADAHVDTKSRIYIFVSRSIPIAVLRSFAADIDTFGSDNIRLAFKAFPRKFLNTFLQKDQARKNGDDMVRAKIIVGEEIFDRYRVDMVPAVVFDPDPTTSHDDWLLVYGADSLHQALTLFHRASGRNELKMATNRVEKIE
jgi:biotin synthase-related radical SAM superfamily protein